MLDISPENSVDILDKRRFDPTTDFLCSKSIQIFSIPATLFVRSLKCSRGEHCGSNVAKPVLRSDLPDLRCTVHKRCLAWRRDDCKNNSTGMNPTLSRPNRPKESMRNPREQHWFRCIGGLVKGHGSIE